MRVSLTARRGTSMRGFMAGLLLLAIAGCADQGRCGGRLQVSRKRHNAAVDQPLVGSADIALSSSVSEGRPRRPAKDAAERARMQAELRAGGWLNHAEVCRLAQEFGKYRIGPKTTLVVKTSIGKGGTPNGAIPATTRPDTSASGAGRRVIPMAKNAWRRSGTRSGSWSVNSARGSIH
jgi:hypothetical protein